MLNFLFQLGQLFSLVALALGFILTIRYRNWDHQPLPVETRMTEINLLASIRQSHEQSVSLTASDAAAGNRDAVVA